MNRIRAMEPLRAAVIAALVVVVMLCLPGVALADDAGPVISATAPVSGASVTAPVTLRAHVADADLIDGASSVFLVDGVPTTITVAYGGYWDGDGCDTWWIEVPTTADFSASLPVLSYGPHTITMKAYDRLGNVSLSSWTINGLTSVAFSSPLPLSGSRNVAVSHVEVALAGPSIAASTVAIAIDGTTVTAAYLPTDANHGRASADVVLADGSHTVRVVASDGAAPLSSTTWSFFVDHAFTGPDLTALTPADGTVVDGPFSVGVHAASAELVNGAGSRLLVDGVAQAPSSVVYPQAWFGSGCDSYLDDDRTSGDLRWDVGDLSAGVHSLAVRVCDDDGIFTVREFTVVRSARLTFTNQTPANDSRQAAASRVAVDISGGPIDPTSVRMLLDGAPVWATWVSTDGMSGTLSYDAPIAEGSHTVQVSATDMSGSVPAHAAWTFYVDTIAPALSVTPDDGVTLTDAAATIRLTAADAGHVDPTTFVLKSDGATLSPLAVSAVDAMTTSATWTGVLSEGVHHLAASVTDYGGLVSARTWTVTVADTPKFGSPTPPSGGLTGPRVALSLPVSDTNDALDAAHGAQLTIDGAPVPASLTLADARHGTARATLSGLFAGTHTAVLTARDEAGNVGTLTWTFNTETNAPVLAAGSQTPAPGVVLASSVVNGIAARFTDPNGVDSTSVTATVDGEPLGLSAYYDGDWAGSGCDTWWQEDPTRLVVSATSSPRLHDGAHTIAVSVSDVLGNRTTHSWSFSVAEYPSIGSIQPAALARSLSQTVTLSANVSDYDGILPGSVSVQWRAANYGQTPTAWQTLFTADGSFSTTFHTPTTETRYEFRILASDTSGHVTTATTDYYATTDRPTMSVDGSCTRCHTTILTTHRMTNCAACHGNPVGPCSCHGRWTHGTDLLDHAVVDEHGGQWVGRTCSDCHGHGADQEAQRHATTSTTCSPCHATAFTTEHYGRTTKSGQTFTCETCHDSTDPTVAGAIAAGGATCTTCHQVQSGHTSMHNSTVTTGTITFFDASAEHATRRSGPIDVNVTCSMCHESMNLVTLHAGRCATCHSGTAPPADSFDAWNGSCSQGSCHPTYHDGSSDGHDYAYKENNYDTCENCHRLIPYSGVTPMDATPGACGACHNVPDKTPPATTVNALPSYIGTASIEFSLADDQSGGQATFYRMDGGATATVAGALLVPPAITTGHSLQYWSIDTSGNVETPKSVNFTVVADVTPPVTSSDAKPLYWNDATVRLTATDNATVFGVRATYYTIDGGAVRTGTSAAVPFDAGKTHTVRFWSVDYAGNTESQKTATVVFSAAKDTVAPSTTCNPAASYTGTATVVLSATDTGLGASGVKTTYYRVDMGTPQTGTVVVVAPPATGTVTHTIYYWSVDNQGNSETPHTVSFKVSAVASTSYTLKYAAGTNGTLSGVTSQTVAYGGPGTAVTALPTTGYHFVSWTDGKTSNPRQDTNVMANVNVTATFAINTYALKYSAGPNGTLSGVTSQTVNYNGSGTAVTANPSTGYHFVNWSDGSTSNPRTDTNVTANKTLTANFAINTYTLTYSAGAGGTISGTSPQTVAHGSSGTAVTAVANSGYRFVNWSDGGTANPRTDANVTANKTLTANFAIVVVDATPPVTAATVQASYSGTATIVLTATDNSGGSGVAATYYILDSGAQVLGTAITVAPPTSGSASHTLEYWSVDGAGNVEMPHKTASFTVAPLVGGATLSFRFEPESLSSAELHVENADGVTIASTSLHGVGADLDWDVSVPAGQSYLLVCDYYYDGDSDSEGGGYSTWLYAATPNTSYTWWY